MSQNPFGLNFVDSDRSRWVCLGRIADTPEPDYVVHGKTKCLLCDKWCWLGSETFKLINSGVASPWCLQCATEHMQHAVQLDYVKDQ